MTTTRLRRLAAILSAGALALGPLTPADATSAPTLVAPSSASYYATVALSGTTPEPDEPVEILFRAAGTTSYIAYRHLTSDSTGHYATTYTALVTQYIAARAGGVNSYVHVVRVPTAHCSVSAPAFTKLSLSSGLSASNGAHAQFSATRGYTWGGTVWDGPNVWLYTWHGSTPHVLARYRLPSGNFSYDDSVRPIGFTPGYALVANVQDMSHHTGMNEIIPLRAYYWYHGVRYTMSHGPWVAWAATGMSDAGQVVGWAAAGSLTHPTFYEITWPHAGDQYKVLGRGRSAAIDGRGDLSWTTSTGRAILRTREGHIHYLQISNFAGGPWSSSGVAPQGTSENAFYAVDPGSDVFDPHLDQVVRWVVHPGSPDGAMHGVLITGPNGVLVQTVGPQNSLLYGYTRTYLRTSSGANTGMPSQWGGGGPGLNAINLHGTVAFTATDRRVHFLRCTTS